MMKMPFTVEQFFDVFARYNETVWPIQVILNLLALVAVVLLYRGEPSASRGISALLSFLWGWMAIAYHFMFFAAINPTAWFFGAIFVAGAFWFAWIGVVKGAMQLQIRGGVRGWAAWTLIAFALVVYPLLGYLLGHRYPAIPTFGLPCPTTIFTVVTVLLMLSAIGFGATAFGKGFRLYSIATIVILLVFGALAVLNAPRIGVQSRSSPRR